MKKLVIFDLDGTIGNTVESLAYTLNKCLTAFHLPAQPEANYKFYAGDGARTMVERALKDAGDPDLNLFEPMYAMYNREFVDGCIYRVKSFPGLPEVLTELKEKGVHLAVCTNKAHANAIRVVETIYGPDLFDSIKGHCDAYPKKPDPACARLIAKELQVPLCDCLYVGDTNTDMHTGRNAGMKTIGVTWGFRDRTELSQTGADVLIDRPEELLDLVFTD